MKNYFLTTVLYNHHMKTLRIIFNFLGYPTKLSEQIIGSKGGTIFKGMKHSIPYKTAHVNYNFEARA